VEERIAALEIRVTDNRKEIEKLRGRYHDELVPLRTSVEKLSDALKAAVTQLPETMKTIAQDAATHAIALSQREETEQQVRIVSVRTQVLSVVIAAVSLAVTITVLLHAAFR
jgi:uncharacterized coiled-coil protein SlyX